MASDAELEAAWHTYRHTKGRGYIKMQAALKAAAAVREADAAKSAAECAKQPWLGRGAEYRAWRRQHKGLSHQEALMVEGGDIR